MNRFFIRKAAFMSCILLSNVFVAGAQGLQAIDDIVRTGPLQTVRKNIIYNDVIPGDTYSWRIITPSVAEGSVTQDGDYIVFVPNPDVRNVDIEVKYELSGSETTSEATIRIIVTNYNNPVNVIYPDVQCVDEMKSGVAFSPALKYIGKSESKDQEIDDRLDGFSMPLVGDLNGDHKPEIVAMGITGGTALAATGDKIIILNGQTGKELYRYALDELGNYSLRSEPRHNSVSKLAIADMDRNSVGEIVITEVGSMGQVHCIEPVYSGATIIGMKKKWTGWTGIPSTVASFKEPLIQTVDANSVYGSPTPYIADLNADGTPEVIVYNKIYNGVTGELVCTLQTLNDFTYSSYQGTTLSDTNSRNNVINNYAYTGRRPSALWQDDHIPCMAIADINSDGFLDIIAGSKVYIMKDNAGKPALDYIINGPSSVTAQRGTSADATIYVTDGFTAVADIDLDGNLDVIVLAPAESGLDILTSNILYIWDPMNSPATPKAAVYLYTSSYSGTMSYPFVGDINGAFDNYSATKQLPEICFNGGRFYTSNAKASPIEFHPTATNYLTAKGITGSSHAGHGFNHLYYLNHVHGHIIGFTYHAAPDGSTPMHERLKLSWAMEHGDQSSCTGITMFDFDNDNIKELCYRDEKSVRVISPARKKYINYDEEPSETGAIRFKYATNIGSYTGFEAPVIADVNMDGSADIVTLVHNTAGHASKGFVHVFEHAPGTDMWAPCPPVWNQGIYFPLQINEDLTVPAKTQSMLTAYQDVNGNTIYPYNGQWIQQPVVKLNEKYIPQVRMPDAILMDMDVKVKVTLDSAIITLTIYNGGSATVNAQTPITFYDGGTTGTDINDQATTQITTLPVGIDIFPGDKVVMKYDIVGNFNDHLIWARIVDDKGVFPADGYLECDITNNVFSGADCPYLIYTVTAAPDTAMCGMTDKVTLTAEPKEQPRYTPVYQWYHDDVPIQGATEKTYTATLTGAYKCFVIEGICREFSNTKIITREMPITYKAPDIRIDVCPLPERQIRLTKFIDTIDKINIKWTKINSGSPDINPETGEINTQRINSTYTYRYSMTAKCGATSAIAYVHALKDKYPRKVDTIVICKDLSTSNSIHINRILGLELKGGTWSYPADTKNTISSNIKSIPASSKYSGAIVFDAHKAWDEATDNNHIDYAINYKGDTNAKKFVFRYTVADSCVGAISKNIVIVVTET
jgi:hypothetical protein